MADIDPWERNIDWQLLIAFSHSNRAITRLTRAAGLPPGKVLFSTREYKKSSVRFFLEED